MTIEDTPFALILFANARHRNASYQAFKAIFIRLCQASGMLLQPTVAVTQDVDKGLELAVKTRLEKVDRDTAERIANAENISSAEAETIKKTRFRTSEQENAIRKFFLTKTYNCAPEVINADFVLTYDNDKVKQVFRSQRTIRSYGTSAKEAITNMRNQQIIDVDETFQHKAPTLLQATGSAGTEDPGRQAALRLWHDISSEECHSHKAAHDLLGEVTGLSGLHCAEGDGALVAGKEIRKRLGYTVGRRGGVDKKGRASEEAVCKLEEIRKELRIHVPGCNLSPFEGKVKLKRVVASLNSVLGAMYGMSFCRDGSGGDQYQLKKSDIFAYPDTAAMKAGCQDEDWMPEIQPWGHDWRLDDIESRVRKRELAQSDQVDMETKRRK